MKLLLTIADGLDYPVRLFKHSTRENMPLYRVEYGADVKNMLSHAQAASELGLAVMHSLECLGKLD